MQKCIEIFIRRKPQNKNGNQTPIFIFEAGQALDLRDKQVIQSTTGGAYIARNAVDRDLGTFCHTGRCDFSFELGKDDFPHMIFSEIVDFPCTYFSFKVGMFCLNRT